jgi:hypothetical protein
MAPVVPDLTGPPTPELEEELERQATQLLARVLEDRDRVEALRALAAAAESQLERDEAMLRHLHTLLGRSVQLSLDTLDTHLRGARVREVALQILEQRDDEAEGVHYREWFEWLREAGYIVLGRDPLATFLAQIGRSPEIERVGGARSGRYRVKR